MKSFKIWLITEYLGSDCPFGDLADDVNRDAALKNKYSASSIRTRIRRSGNDIGGHVQSVLDDAIAEYSVYKSSEVD